MNLPLIPTRQMLVGLARDYFLMTVGSVLIAVGVDVFLAPNEVISAGVTGIAMLANFLWGWPVGIVTLLLNLPLFVAGWRWAGGLRFILRTMYATTVMSLAIDILKPYLSPVVGDPLITTIFGGLLDGIGVGLVLRGRGTTGGTDILAQLLNQFRRVSFGTTFLVSNAIILFAAVGVIDLVRVLYAVLVTYISARTIDAVHEGLGLARAVLVISDRSRDVLAAIQREVGRGVTIFPGRGGYTGAEREVLYAVVSRAQLTHVTRLVAQIDPQAFVVVSDAHEVLGEGFRPLRHA